MKLNEKLNYLVELIAKMFFTISSPVYAQVKLNTLKLNKTPKLTTSSKTLPVNRFISQT